MKYLLIFPIFISSLIAQETAMPPQIPQEKDSLYVDLQPGEQTNIEILMAQPAVENQKSGVPHAIELSTGYAHLFGKYSAPFFEFAYLYKGSSSGMRLGLSDAFQYPVRRTAGTITPFLKGDLGADLSFLGGIGLGVSKNSRKAWLSPSEKSYTLDATALAECIFHANFKYLKDVGFRAQLAHPTFSIYERPGRLTQTLDRMSYVFGLILGL
jgi:hypothetical protein